VHQNASHFPSYLWADFDRRQCSVQENGFSIKLSDLSNEQTTIEECEEWD
jgi:hypothetical protein